MELLIGARPAYDDAALACVMAEIDAVPSPRTREALFRALERVRTWRGTARTRGYDAVVTLARFAQNETMRRSRRAGLRATSVIVSPARV